jgi:predicted permease
MRNVLIVGQVALSLGLLTAAGLFMRGAIKAGVADPGFPLEGGIIANVSPSLAEYDETRGKAAIRNIIQRVRSTPGVRSASLGSIVPFGEIQEERRVQRAGAPPAAEGQPPAGVDATYTIVGTDYFETLRVPVIRGRGFTQAEEDSAAGNRVAIVDETLARQVFGEEDPIGQRIQLERGQRPRSEPLEVVGVVGGVRMDLFDKMPEPHVYLPFGQNYRGGMNIHVHLDGDAAAETAMLGTVRQVIREVDAHVPLLALKTLRQLRDGGVMVWVVNSGARMFSIFGGMALLLAVVGIYGVRSYLVSRRTREIGIRMALGATRSNVLWLVLREGLALTATGVVIGLVLSWAIGRLLSSMLYEVSPLNPVVFAVAPLLLSVVAIAASFVPARRAATVAPLSALRSE